ncbi:MAG: hypothetical protein ACD_56C00037G0009 [uncultured bacterium]|nr:MAG: hypothetical protein ACD_56C00037G0009 [uncultured bacterium]
MLINVPQYIDVEDKVAGPLTIKQLGWLIALGVMLLILWNVVPFAGFLVIGFPLAIIFGSLAFFKPYGQPMGSFVIFGIMYFFKPKVYIWKRTPQNVINVPQKAKVEQKFSPDKHLTEDSLRNLAQLLDSEGNNYSHDLDDIMKNQPIKKA